MMFQMSNNTESFLTTAPWIFRSELELDLPASTVWDIIIDDRAWIEWHPEVTNIVWMDPEPHKKGSERTVVFKDPIAGSAKIYEVFDIWEEGVRFSMYFREMSLPNSVSYRSAREEFKVEATGDNKSIFTRTVAIEPGSIMRFVAGLIMYPHLKRLFTKTCPKRLQKAVVDGRLPVV